MNILHATTDPTLLTRLKEMLASSARADIAVGYFFMSGFEAVAEDLSKLLKVRILVGRTDQHVLEEVAAGLQQAPALRARLDADTLVQRRQRAPLAQQAVDHIRDGVGMLPQERGTEAAVKALRDLVADGKVEVRTYLRSPLHAKAYLCWYDNHAEPGAAVVGSSNLTLAGFEGNTELNVRVSGDAEMAALKKWFEDLWADSEDISEPLVTELDRSWVLDDTRPYYVYLKALHELYASEIGGGDLPLPTDREPLANFQIDAVKRGLKMIEEHGGCYIGDVVGLGKTFIGAELLRQLRNSYPNDGPPLILCPAGLKPMWEQFNERFGLGAAVVSHSLISAVPAPEFDEELGRYVDAEAPEHGIILEQEYPNRGPVLVDEAHNFRNINQRSRGLRDYLDAGDHKVILLSATPQNLGPMDIYRQLRLFLDNTEHGLNIEPVNLEDYFHNARLWLEYQVDFENYRADYEEWERTGQKGSPPVPGKSKPNVPKAQIEDVLSSVFIRRRRKDIKDLYGDTAKVGGKPVHFPDPVLDNVDYRLDRVYAKAGSLKELEQELERHHGYRYRVTDYIKEEAKEKEEYRDLFRARDRIAKLMGVLLFKRLESSIEAFRSTLTSLEQSNRNFRDALEAGYVPIGSTATRLLSGHTFDAEELLEVLQQEEERRRESGSKKAKLVHLADDFEVENWIDDLDADYEVLRGLLDRVKDITPADDDKLQSLRRFLDRPDVRGSKLLLFSEAETTINYLYRELNPGGRDLEIVRLTGSTHRDAESIVKRFSPISNLRKGEKVPGPEIRVLLATDVVSEGQNLQDCARVLNYDLHWNPVRLIQRFGRIDRIGTEHAEIDLHNMWPDVEVDAQLSLTDRLTRRIQSVHDLIGLDSKLLSEAERLNFDAMYRIYGQKELPELDDGLDEVAANQRAVALLQRIQAEDPTLWQTITDLPDGIRSALKVPTKQDEQANDRYVQNPLDVEGAQAPLMSPTSLESISSPFDDPSEDETLVLLGAGDVHGCYAVGSDLEPRAISPAQLIAAAECDENTPAQPLPKGTNERVMAAFAAFQSDFQTRLGRRRRRRDTKARRYLSRQLSIALRDAEDDTAETQRIEALGRIFLGDVSQQVEGALAEIRNLRLEGSALRTRLEALRERYRLSSPDDEEMAPSQEPQVIRIVCSDGLV